MSETGKLMQQRQDTGIRKQLEKLSTLPGWLVTARSPRIVRDALLSAVPEFASGQLGLRQVEVGHIRYKENFWSGLYELSTQETGPAGSESFTTLQGYIHPPVVMAGREAAVDGSFGSVDWRAVFPDLCLELFAQKPDTTLNALDDLTSPELSRQFLSNSIRDHAPRFANFTVRASTPRVVRYKPGSRCTIVYRLEYEPGLADSRGWPEIVIAKTYRGEKGQNAYDSMLALWNSPLGTSPVVKIAEPLSYDPDRRVLIQGPIREEITLKELFISAVRSGSPQALAGLEVFIRKTAAGLAELHGSEVGLGKTWRWDDEVDEIRDRVQRLSSAIPELAGSVDPLLDRLNEIEADTPLDALVPSHGSFRPAQVLIHQGEIGFIDFDSFSQSEPANDIALFLSTVMSLGLTTTDMDDTSDDGTAMDEAVRRERYQRVQTISEWFLEEYERRRPVSRRRVALWETLDILMLVLHGWIKIKTGELADIVYLLEQFLQRNQIVEER